MSAIPLALKITAGGMGLAIAVGLFLAVIGGWIIDRIFPEDGTS